MKALNLPLPDAEVNNLIDHGLPLSLFEQVAEVLSLSDAMLGQYLGMPPCTLLRMASAGLLSVSESGRLAALIHVLHVTNELFESDAQAAMVFLTSPACALNSKIPLDLLCTESGAIVVTDLIGRLEHGIPI